MQSIEFKVTVKDGIIEIPQAYQDDVINAEDVKVVVVKKEKRKRIVDTGFLAELASNPVEIENLLSREEANER
ncbi:MAG: hypothetical protein KME29_15020 [Calothrix sp. FI2-JRJ7]|nr:hypothetical protein [Calothrix sp. FI2-JRJ7]